MVEEHTLPLNMTCPDCGTTVMYFVEKGTKGPFQLSYKKDHERWEHEVVAVEGQQNITLEKIDLSDASIYRGMCVTYRARIAQLEEALGAVEWIQPEDMAQFCPKCIGYGRGDGSGPHHYADCIVGIALRGEA